MAGFRTEKDSLGEVQVPADALYQAQTQRAVENFPVSGYPMPREFIRALGLIKQAAAGVNRQLGLLADDKAEAIATAAAAVAAGEYDGHFPVDVFQTGSGTSSNMNANEVIASLATAAGVPVHPNDDVNLGQSSNDVIPTAIQLAVALTLDESLLPSLAHLSATIRQREQELADVVKTGRTHLMDAMPLSMAQELSGWRAQMDAAIERLDGCRERLHALPQGGTAVGTGINTSARFAPLIAGQLTALTADSASADPRPRPPFTAGDNPFQTMAGQDIAVEVSGHLRTLAVSLMKIANDLRWMNSGPLAGLGEIELQALQPGSSIMPGKVNPVIPEAVCMVAAQVMGNDVTIAVAGQSGVFQLNVMLPVIAHNLLESTFILSNACRLLADKAVATFKVRLDNIREPLARNPILVTALNARIGYEKAAAIAKQAYASGRPVLDVAAEQTDISREELARLLDPVRLIHPDE